MLLYKHIQTTVNPTFFPIHWSYPHDTLDVRRTSARLQRRQGPMPFTLEVQVYVCWVSIQYINQNWRNFGVNSKQSLNSLSTSSQLPFFCNVDARNHAIWPHRPICECWVPVFFRWGYYWFHSVAVPQLGECDLADLANVNWCLGKHCNRQCEQTRGVSSECGENYLAMEQLTWWSDGRCWDSRFIFPYHALEVTDGPNFQPSWSKLAFKVWIAGWRISAANCQWFQR